MLADVTVSEVGVKVFVTTEQKHRYEKRNDGGGSKIVLFFSCHLWTTPPLLIIKFSSLWDEA